MTDHDARKAQDKRRMALIERIGTIADMTAEKPLQGELGDIAYDLLRQAAAQISSDRKRLASLPAPNPAAVCKTCFGYRYVVAAPSTVSAGGEPLPCPACTPAVTFGAVARTQAPNETEGMADLLTKAIGDITAALTLAGRVSLVARWTAPYVEVLNEFDEKAPHPPEQCANIAQKSEQSPATGNGGGNG